MILLKQRQMREEFVECVRTEKTVSHQCYHLHADTIFRCAGNRELRATPPARDLRPRLSTKLQTVGIPFNSLHRNVHSHLRPLTDSETCVPIS